MPATEQTYQIACRGGLDLTTNTQELLQKPGWATRLINFEPANDGGYRRIEGFTQLGTGRTPGIEETRIKGVQWVDDTYAIACHESSVYLSYDLTNWVQINKVMDLVANPNGLTHTEIQAASDFPRASGYHYDFEIFRQGTSVIVMGACEGHSPFYFTAVGTTLADTLYSYKELSLTSGSLVGALHTEKFKDQYVISGMDVAPAEIYYSDILKPDDFEGANAGSIGFNDVVRGIKMFREDLYVFCQNSIHKVSGLSSGSPQRLTVTTKIGCINGDSIQELAGDLVFLSADGLRTLSATARIGDVNLATLSDAVASRIRIINKEIELYDVRTETLKSKVQYRIFFRGKEGTTVAPYSAIMHMSLGQQGNLTPEFSELQGFEIAAIDNGFYGGQERTISGDLEGNLWFHDEGIDFNGKQIYFLYDTPFFSIDDPGMRKNIHKLISYIRVEGEVNFNLAVKYDYGNSEAYQPAPYHAGPYKAPAIYGLSKYNTANVQYGSTKDPIVSTLTEGSGKTISIRIFPSGERCDSFSLQGFDVYYVPSGRI